MAEGTESYGGLGVPLFGESKIVGNTAANDVFTIEGAGSQSGDLLVLQSSTPTELFYVESDGVSNWAITNPGADNVLAIAITDASTVTTGYVQGCYVSLATTGAYTTGNTQVNGFAVDLTWVGGTVGCEFSGMYIYMAGSGSPTLTSANISGLNIYLADLGGTPGNKCALQLHIEDDGVATGMDAFIVCRLEGASGATAAFVQFAGTATLPEFFIKTNSAAGAKMIRAYTASDAATLALTCNVNGSLYNIPMVPDSCS
jgi:hypothetical protein